MERYIWTQEFNFKQLIIKKFSSNFFYAIYEQDLIWNMESERWRCLETRNTQLEDFYFHSTLSESDQIAIYHRKLIETLNGNACLMISFILFMRKCPIKKNLPQVVVKKTWIKQILIFFFSFSFYLNKFVKDNKYFQGQSKSEE